MQVAARTRAAIANDPLDIVRSDGSVLHTLSYSAPLFDETGNVRGVVDACVDVTEHKALEERVQRAEKFASLALMAGGIAHDFNNLLTVIIGHASYLAAELPDRSPLHSRVNELETAAARAADLVSQLLAFTGRFWCDAKLLNLSAEIEEMKSSIRGMVQGSIAVRFDLASDLPLIQGGGTEIRQVIRNLVANAQDALSGSEDGEIEIRTTRTELLASQLEIFYPDQPLAPGTYVRLEMIDSGCGIPREIADRIFDPFFTTKFFGRGLGLSAVQGIVRAHQGGIRVDSYPGRGTRVEVIFPAHFSGTIPQGAPGLENAGAGPLPARIQ
jgi:two-component system, cell cycle sensor histidine kinase and response regulator CckA